MKRVNFYVLCASVALIAWAGLAAAAPSDDSYALVQSVNLTAGIAKDQASAIAQIYFERYISGCGAADTPVDAGEHWDVTPRIGYAGTRSDKPIIIDKHTGRVSRVSGPTFRNLADLLSGQRDP